MKRASIRGQGDDIFFGLSEATSTSKNDENSTPRFPTSARPLTPTPASPDAVTSRLPDPRTSGRVDVPTSSSDEAPFLTGLRMPSQLRRKLRAVLREERRIHTTVRFSADEMAALRDLVYQLEAKVGIKITRNEVMRIALHFFLEDYELRKKESLLLQVLEEIDD